MKLGDIIVIVIIILVAVAYFTFGFGKLPESESLITTTTPNFFTDIMKPPVTTTTTTTPEFTDPVLNPDHEITTWTMDDVLSEIYIGDIKVQLPCTISNLPEGIEAVKSPYDDTSGCIQLNIDGSAVANGYYFIEDESIYNITLLNSDSNKLSVYEIDSESTISDLETKLGPANDKYENEKIGYYQYSYIFDDNNYIVFEFSDNILSTVNICCIR